jgi:hypothetical protein
MPDLGNEVQDAQPVVDLKALYRQIERRRKNTGFFCRCWEGSAALLNGNYHQLSPEI